MKLPFLSKRVAEGVKTGDASIPAGGPTAGGEADNLHDMVRGLAESIARNYLMRKYGNTHRLGELEDYDSYFSAEIRDPKGDVTERLLINKQNGNIHSL